MIVGMAAQIRSRLRGWLLRSAGNATIMTLGVATAVVVIAAGVVGLTTQGAKVSERAAASAAALGLAESGLQRAMDLLALAPRWGQLNTPHTLERTVVGPGHKGSYTTTVTATGRQVAEHPLVEIVSTGTTGSETRTITARALVRPAPFLLAALALYDGYDDAPGPQGSLETKGDVYVFGAFGQPGRICIDGNLYYQTLTQGNPIERDQCPGGGSQSVLGTKFPGLTRESPNHRPTPREDAAWYRWAQRTLWSEIYAGSGYSPPDTVTFQYVMEQAARADRPYGVMYFIDGDWTLNWLPGPPPGAFQGHATIVVNGVLTIDINKIEATPGSHLALISLGGIRLLPGSIGPFHALLYTYRGRGEPAARIWRGTPSGMGEPSQLGNLKVHGTLAGGSLTKVTGFLEILGPRDQLITGAAPAIPGMEPIRYDSVTAAPGDVERLRRWRND